MAREGTKFITWISVLLLIFLYSLTAPQNHSEAEDVYQFAKVVEQGTFADQAGVNRVLALPIFGTVYHTVQALGYSGRAFGFMIFVNRLLAVGALFLFYGLLQSMYRRRPACLVSISLLLAFSYGFWRYANEAETYMLASVLVLGAWYLVAKGKWMAAVLVSALGVLVHLLNLIPLLLIIPLYYLLSKDWKKAWLHGGLTGLLVLTGYALCYHYLDWSELGAQHHGDETGFSLMNLVRAGIAFGQCLVSGNFLFGFEGFRDLLVKLFPSRMLDEEFYMAAHMPGWIPVAGCITLLGLFVAGCWLLVVRRNVDEVSCLVMNEPKPQAPSLKSKAFFYSVWVWLLLYVVAVLRTEAGSPELWILALIPFWLLVAPLFRGRWVSGLVLALFLHNLIAGLLLVMPATSDYHAAKGRWLVENGTANDLILTSYEPVMIFYLDYFSSATLVNSGEMGVDEIEELLENHQGKAYALFSFFQPLESMRVRSPKQFEKMQATGQILFPRFGKVVDNEFGGIFELKNSGGLGE